MHLSASSATSCKTCLAVWAFALGVSGLFAQTVYVPGGTGGIGTSSNGNVGIGTSIPSKTLVVSSSADAQGLLVTSTSGRSLITLQSGTGTANPELDFNKVAGYANAFLLSDETNNRLLISTNTGGGSLEFWTGSQQPRVKIDGNGNVGIGTTNPGYPLDVLSGGIGGARFSIASSSTNVTSIVGTPIVLQNRAATPGNYAATLYYDANNNLQGSIGMMYGAHSGPGQGTFYIEPRIVATPSSFVVAPSGRIGVGTASPDRNLVVYDANAPLLKLSGSTTTDGDVGDILFYNRAGSSSMSAVHSGIRAQREGGNDNIGLGLMVANGVDSPTEAVRIAHNGSVGIGTTSPGAHLDITHTAGNFVHIVHIDGGGNGTNGNFLLMQAVDYSDAFPLVAFTTAHSITGRANNLVRIHSNETGAGGLPLRVTAQGTVATPTYEALAVDYRGYVGVGTTAPIDKLTVENTADSNARVKADGANGRAQLIVDSPAGLWQIEDASGASGNHPPGALGFTESGVGPRVTFLKGGNVGIGTTNPQAKLDVNGNANVSGSLTVSGSFSAPNYTASSGAITGGAGGLTLSAGGTNQNVTVSPSGNGATLLNGDVGLGTSTPSAKLDISVTAGASAIRLGGTSFYDGTTSASDGTSLLNYFTNAGNRQVMFADSSQLNSTMVPGLRILTGGAAAAIDSVTPNGASARNLIINGTGGSVGIGTAAPDRTLTVKGTIHATEVVVDTTVAAKDLKVQPSAWADDVFEAGHPVAPLSEVEQSIKTQGHLPGVPSAKEVAANGVSVGQMQTILLRKIEELTLHQIEQEKVLQEQRSLIDSMNKRLQQLATENAALRAR